MKTTDIIKALPVTDRIRSLKQTAYDNGHHPENYPRSAYVNAKGRYDAPNYYAHNLKRAAADEFFFDNYPIEVDPRELIVGRFAHDAPLSEQEKTELDKYNEALVRFGQFAGTSIASTGHRVLDYEKLLNTGVDAIIAEIDEHIARTDYNDPENSEKRAFYLATRRSLCGFVKFCDRARLTLLSLAENESDEKRKGEYLAMAENFSCAPSKPCEHFWQAMQIVWFLQFSLHLLGDTCLCGRLDNYLYPFYKKDIDDGVITREFAYELICSLFYKHNEIYDTWPASIMVGGVDRDGKPNWNELSYMCIKAIEDTGLINPSVTVAYTTDMPEDLLGLCIEVIAKGYTKPAIFNDRVIQKGLREAGVSEQDARYYIHSTCVEITPIGASHIRVATPYIDLNKAYEYIFNGGRKIFGNECHLKPEVALDLDALVTFDDFYALLRKCVAAIIAANLDRICDESYMMSRYYSAPLSSAFINDCISSGRDTGDGGARYSFVYPCFPGFMNLVDALGAIKKTVYETKQMTLAQFGDMLRANFEGYDEQSHFIDAKCPKFGNDIDEVDEIGSEMFNFIRDELLKYKISVDALNPGSGTFHPSYFAWIMHAHLGSQAAASPDGRRQGTALSESLGAVQGNDKNGPTALMHSVAKIDQKYGIGGIATNIRFSKSLVGTPAGKEAVAAYIKSFMAADNFEIQFNVVDQKTLLDAREHPENYRTLMVRVAGYSDYFVNLNPVIQNEVIKRTEHENF